MRNSGILLHISSLPSEYNIGTLGKNAYDFVDFLHQSKQSYWQILPIGPTIFKDSPYQTTSIFAGNTYFIDYDLLCENGLIEKSDYENEQNSGNSVNYAILFNTKYKILQKAFSNRHIFFNELKNFITLNQWWLEDFALYSTIKENFNHTPWNEWPNEYKTRNTSALEKFSSINKEAIDFYVFCQFLFFKQWTNLKQYSNSKNIKIIGDIPIYVAYDSADVWKNPHLFELNKNSYEPTLVAGCPPDKFAKKGQLWGNPLYNWTIMEEENFSWWVERLRQANEMFDVIRIDHFRGFSKYYAIPFKAKTAKNGKWKSCPGNELFKQIKKELPNINIIAENLGFLDDDVHKLLENVNFPGMKVLQFELLSYVSVDELYKSIDQNTVLYTGTHDNPTIVSWYDSLSRKNKKNLKSKLNILNKEDGLNWTLIKIAFESNAQTVIIPIQDFFGEKESARMNTPSTVNNNWIYKTSKEKFSEEIIKKISSITNSAKRV